MLIDCPATKGGVGGIVGGDSGIERDVDVIDASLAVVKAGRLEQRVQFQKGQQKEERGAIVTRTPEKGIRRNSGRMVRGQGTERVIANVGRQTHLPKIIGAFDSVGRLADLLHSRQQKPDQDRDDCDHHEQLDQGEAASHDSLTVFWPPLFRLETCRAQHELNSNYLLTASADPPA